MQDCLEKNFSFMRIPFSGEALFNMRMKTIDEIHRERLAMLRRELGGVGKLAKTIGKDSSQVSQWLNASLNSGTGKARGMSDDQCRHIEEMCGKSRGWMDSDPDKVDALALMQLISLYLQSTELGQDQILASAKTAEKATA